MYLDVPQSFAPSSFISMALTQLPDPASRTLASISTRAAPLFLSHELRYDLLSQAFNIKNGPHRPPSTNPANPDQSTCRASVSNKSSACSTSTNHLGQSLHMPVNTQPYHRALSEDCPRYANGRHGAQLSGCKTRSKLDYNTTPGEAMIDQLSSTMTD